MKIDLIPVTFVVTPPSMIHDNLKSPPPPFLIRAPLQTRDVISPPRSMVHAHLHPLIARNLTAISRLKAR